MTQLTINTTQNVNINFTAATLGQRILAILVDFLIMLAYMITISWLFFDVFGLNTVMKDLDRWSVAAIFIILYMPVIVYTIVQESIFEGQTFGKRLLKIKVVKIDGYQASFGDYFIRWLFRIIEIFSNGGLIGLTAIIATEKSQRLGDLSAGTAVISLKNNVTINSTILQEIDNEYVPTYPSVIKLSDNDMRIIKDTYLDAKRSRDPEIIHKLRLKIEEVAGIKNQMGNNHDFIKTVLKDYNFYTQNM
jgi:uncharacterized RDD family membrane protein YckC